MTQVLDQWTTLSYRDTVALNNKFAALDAAIAGLSGDGGGTGAPLSSGVISLSSAQLLDLANTPVEIVAAPGEDEIIVPVQVISTSTFGTVAYTDREGRLAYGSHTTDDDNLYSFLFAPTANSAYLADSFTSSSIPVSGFGGSNLKSVTAGLPLNLLVNGAVTDGDGTGTIEVFYRIVSWP